MVTLAIGVVLEDGFVSVPVQEVVNGTRAQDTILRCRINAAFRSQVERRIYAAAGVPEEICPAPTALGERIPSLTTSFEGLAFRPVPQEEAMSVMGKTELAAPPIFKMPGTDILWPGMGEFQIACSRQRRFSRARTSATPIVRLQRCVKNGGSR